MLVALLAASISLADGEPQPKIHIPHVRYDFGKVFEQETYEHDFKVMNRGTADLVIADVKPG